MAQQDDRSLSQKIEWFKKQYQRRATSIDAMSDAWARLYEKDWRQAAQVLDEIAANLDEASHWCSFVIHAHESHHDPKTGEDITARDWYDPETGELIRDDDPTHIRPGPPFVGKRYFLSANSDSTVPDSITLSGKMLAWAKRTGGEVAGLKIALLTVQSSENFESDQLRILAKGVAYFEIWRKMPVHLLLEYWWYDYEPYRGYEEDRAAYFSALVLAEGVKLNASNAEPSRLALALTESDPQHSIYQALLLQLPTAVWQVIQEDVSFTDAGKLRNRVANLIAGKERKAEPKRDAGDFAYHENEPDLNTFEASEHALIEMRDRLDRNDHPSREEEAMLWRAEGLKYKEIAERMGVEIGTVKTLIFRARSRDKKKSTEIV